MWDQIQKDLDKLHFTEAKIKRNTVVKLLGDKNFRLNETNLNVSLMVF